MGIELLRTWGPRAGIPVGLKGDGLMRLTVSALAAAMLLGACAPQTIISNQMQAVISASDPADAVALAEKECGKRGRWPLLQRQGGSDYWFSCNETDEAIAARQEKAREAAQKSMAALRAMPAPVPALVSAVAAPAPPAASAAAKTPETPVAAAETSAAPKAKSRQKAGRGSWVQLGAFRNKATAEQYVAAIRKAHAPVVKDHNVVLSEGKAGARGTMLLARLGPFPRAAAARSACNSLKARGAACFVAASR